MKLEMSGVLGLLYWVAIIVFLLKGKMKWVTFLALLTFSIYPFAIGMICMYALPKNNIHGDVIPGLPMGISLILIILAIYSIKSPKLQQAVPHKKTLKIGWFYLILALAIYFIGVCVTLMYFYTPQAFGYTASMPHYGVTANVILNFASTVFLYLASRRGSVMLPNLFRIISTLIILLFYSQTTLVISLILMYAYPVTPLTSYPTLAGLNLLSYLFFGALFILIRREFVSVDSTKANLKGASLAAQQN